MALVSAFDEHVTALYATARNMRRIAWRAELLAASCGGSERLDEVMDSDEDPRKTALFALFTKSGDNLTNEIEAALETNPTEYRKQEPLVGAIISLETALVKVHAGLLGEIDFDDLEQRRKFHIDFIEALTNARNSMAVWISRISGAKNG